MPGIERKILTFVEKHLLLIGALFSSALALYLRKIAVWWYYGAASFYFDMHPNHIQTTFYDLVVRLLQYLPALPLHSVKWLAGLSDFGVAGLLVLALGREASGLKRLAFYLAGLYSPILFLRGVTWGQLDSLAIFLLLAGYLLYRDSGPGHKRLRRCAALLTGSCAIALCPWFLGVAVWYVWMQERRQRDFWKTVSGMAAVVVVLLLSGALVLRLPWPEGVYSFTRFLTYHPESGLRYQNGAEWLFQMCLQGGSGASVLTMLAAGRRKFSYRGAILTQIVSVVLCGTFLFREIG